MPERSRSAIFTAAPDELFGLLELTGYDPRQDRLVLLGDYVDRGPDSRGALEAVAGLLQQGEGGVHALRGNHDHRFLQLLQTPSPALLDKFLEHGGRETLSSYSPDGQPVRGSRQARERLDEIRAEYFHHIDLLEKLQMYAEDEHPSMFMPVWTPPAEPAGEISPASCLWAFGSRSYPLR